MEKLTYNKKTCKCGKLLKISGYVDNGKYTIFNCNNPNCLKKYIRESDKVPNEWKPAKLIK